MSGGAGRGQLNPVHTVRNIHDGGIAVVPFWARLTAGLLEIILIKS